LPTEIIVSIITVAGAVVGSVIGAYASANLTNTASGCWRKSLTSWKKRWTSTTIWWNGWRWRKNSLKSFHHRMDDVNSELEHIKGGT